jgi:hypothetical protein
MSVLEELLSQRDEINRELSAQRESLKEIIEVQENGFRRMEVGLERTCHHLQMYLTGFAAKDTTALESSEVDNLDDSSRKGLLRKLFS